MSRIGKMPVAIPPGVTVDITAGNFVTVKGPKGSLSRKLVDDMKIEQEAGQVTVERPSELKRHKSLHGLTRTLLANMVEGVTNGYTKVLEIQGVGYRAAKEGDKLNLSLGYSHPIQMIDPEGITSSVEGNRITVTGIDKERVGQYAAEIRAKREPEPYKGKGIRYQNEYVRRKAGKAGKK